VRLLSRCCHAVEDAVEERNVDGLLNHGTPQDVEKCRPGGTNSFAAAVAYVSRKGALSCAGSVSPSGPVHCDGCDLNERDAEVGWFTAFPRSCHERYGRRESIRRARRAREHGPPTTGGAPSDLLHTWRIRRRRRERARRTTDSARARLGPLAYAGTIPCLSFHGAGR
jgi:hypothetical protein